MNDTLTQQQMSELAQKHQQYQYQAEALAQQMNMVNITVKDVETALTTIAALKDEQAGKETLVPIGFGSFVKAALAGPDKVVVGLGAGVSVEKNTEDAKAFLEKRKDELIKYREHLNTTIGKIAEEMQHIQRLAQKHQQAQQQAQQPMRAE